MVCSLPEGLTGQEERGGDFGLETTAHIEIRSLIRLPNGKRMIISSDPLGSEQVDSKAVALNGKLYVNGSFVRDLLPDELTSPERVREVLDSLFLPELEG